MVLLVAPALRAAPAPEAPDWFRVFQYAARTVSLRGCSECKGEPDDVCEVRGGAQTSTLDEYARGRWPAPGRVKLLRSRADSDCAVPAAGPAGLFGPRAQVELAAIRLARSPPTAALLEKLPVRFAVHGWPTAPRRRAAGDARSAQGAASNDPRRAIAQRGSLRLALVCWSAAQGWPASIDGGADARAALDANNPCEWWLLPVKPGSGEPDLGSSSFALAPRGSEQPESFTPGDARFARAFDRSAALDEALLLGEGQVASQTAAPAPAAPAPEQPAAPKRCSAAAATRTATLDRFDQWEAQIRGAGRGSLDRKGFTLDAQAWSGHCEELDVLRAALEQQLGCTVSQQGRCAGAGQIASGSSGARP